MRLFINEKELQLTEDTKIAQTKQVNNLMSIETRQCNYTNSFKIKKTKPNIATMEMLGVIGNLSNIPYGVNRVDLFGDTGECFVYQGRCTVTTSDPDFYELQILDGNVDIYKSMSNDKLSVLDLTSITHERTVANIISTWSESSVLNYKYIVADFNGKSTTDEGYLNADFLVPSVRVSYLWDAIFSFYGFTYSGVFFDSPRFKNLWLTYPKGVQINNSENITMFDSDDFYFKTSFGNYYKGKGAFMSFNTSTVNIIESTVGNLAFKISETGTYRFKVNGRLNLRPRSPFWNGKEFPFRITLGKNLTGSINRDTNAESYTDWITLASNILVNGDGGGAEFDKETLAKIEGGDTIYLMVKQDIFSEWFITDNEEFGSDLTFLIEKVTDEAVDFGEALQDFGVKEFFNEIITRHALVPIKDKYTNNYSFYTMDVLINKTDSLDWSDKFVEFEKENYLYNSYEQRNYFRYKYDTKESEHNDGYLSVNNLNLDDKKTVYQSQLYSPESVPTDLLEIKTNVYRLWDKKLDKDSNISYDSLDKHFYFLNYNIRNYAGTLKSELYNQQSGFISYPMESFNDLSYYNAILNNYKGMSRLLNRSSIVTAKFKLNDYDITNLDFSRKIYSKQLGYDFFINKVMNYLDKTKPVSLELVRISENTDNSTPTDPVSPATPIIRVAWVRVISTVIRIRVYYDTGFFASSSVFVEVKDLQDPVSRPNASPVEFIMSSTRLYVPMNLRLSNSAVTTDWFGFILNSENRETT